MQKTEIQYTLNFSINTVRFVKSFSKGQITIPKEFRDMFGLTYHFWLKLYINNGKIIAEPIEKENDQDEYLKKILSITGEGFSPREIEKNRKEVEKQLAKREL